MKQSWLIAVVVGLACSTIPMFILSRYLPGRVVSYEADTRDPLSGWSILYLQADAFIQGAASAEQPRVALPVRLTIPHINVDAPFEYVGLTPDGAMDVPKDRESVAWFEQGTTPGQIGSAVIAGHYGRRNGNASAFDDLHKLRPGDRVHVEDDEGKVTTFVVRTSRRYDPDADAAGVFGSSDGKTHLNLVTCEGAWDEAAGGYPTRLVVFTDME